jgi:protein-disulfide isomerase
MISRLGNAALNVATGLVTAVALVIGGLRIYSVYSPPTHAQSVPVTKVVESWRTYANEGIRVGPEGAAVTIVEFSDFQCPYCRKAAKDLHRLRDSFPNDVAIVYRHLPIHQFARAAAVAATCANRVGAFQAYHDQLFGQPDSIGTKRWTRFAWEAGIRDTVRFAACLHDQSVDAAIRRDSVAAIALEISETPTLLINHLMVIGSPGYARLREYVAAALREADRK